MIDPEDKEYYTRLDAHRELEERVVELEKRVGLHAVLEERIALCELSIIQLANHVHSLELDSIADIA